MKRRSIHIHIPVSVIRIVHGAAIVLILAIATSVAGYSQPSVPPKDISSFFHEVIGECFVRPLLGLNATFLQGEPPPGNIAFISQSGALGSAIVDWAVSAGIGFSMFASLGSMIDLDFGDMIDFLGDDAASRSILIYMEGVALELVQRVIEDLVLLHDQGHIL